MNIDYLQSFQKYEEVKHLDADVLKLFSGFVNKNTMKKIKKKVVIKSNMNLLKNSKLQSSKDTTKNKVNLIINKLSDKNINELIIEFIKTFQEVDQIEFNKIIEVFFLKIVNDEKFTNLFFDFFIRISNIYTHLFNFEIKHFVDLIELKIKKDYLDIELDDEYSILEKTTSEEQRISNLKLVILLINKSILNKKVIKKISEYLVNTDYIPDIYKWFSNPTIKKNDKIESYNDTLKAKLSQDLNHGNMILLKSLLDINRIEYDDINILSDEDINDDEKLEINKEDQNDSDYEISIKNIIEEYLFLEEFDEIVGFINDNKLVDKNLEIFTNSLINIYFINNLSNSDKFKNLFINIKKNKLIQNEIFKLSLIKLIESDEKEDYNNFDSKLSKLIEIYKIIQIKLPKVTIDKIV